MASKSRAKVSGKAESSADCGCNDPHEEPSDDDVRRRVAREATRVLFNLGGERTLRTVKTPEVRAFLTGVHHLALDGTQAMAFSRAELESYVTSLAVVDSALDVIALMADNGGGGGGGGLSCVGRCRQEKNVCLQDCAGIGFPCFCCADCRLAYLGCAADCILSSDGSFGGGGGIVAQ